MVTPHNIPVIPTAVAASPQERVEAGDRVAHLMEHPGWVDLMEGIRVHQEGKTAMLMGTRPTSEGAQYAGMVGELKGLSEIKAIAAGIVKQGETDAVELRAVENGGF